MVDFAKRLTGKPSSKATDPIEIYDKLDRASDKGPLRPAQIAVLTKWHQSLREKRDTIVKLHTGQGKTLIGLLMLQSKLNELGEPAVYLCPNNFLIKQTCSQAAQFGVKFCESDGGDLPQEFLDGKAIYITSIQKMFNGLSKFGIGSRFVKTSTLLMDDCHACIDAIRDAFTIKLDRKHAAYQSILNLFSQGLEDQGLGTFLDVKTGNPEAFLPVPYWDWVGKNSEVAAILSKVSSDDEVKFAWPLLKNSLEHCFCVIGGGSLEIQPHLPPLDLFGSYFNAKTRVFMSATVSDDSFLVKGLRLSKETILNPLVYDQEKWSGEKMILLPALLHEDLKTTEIVDAFARQDTKRRFGIVVLAPSFKSAEKWKQKGAIVATAKTIESEIAKLRDGKYSDTLVIVNRYDGIDLPDSSCRLLIFDSTPYSESLVDLHSESCRAESEIVALKTARSIEQGLGRSVRGEKDYSVILITGAGLVKTIRNQTTRKFFSNQTRAQVEMGLAVTEMAREELRKEMPPLQALSSVIFQCLNRDEGWKDYYAQQMDAIEPLKIGASIVEVFEKELKAEEAFQKGAASQAVAELQDLIDHIDLNESDKRWYMQEIARYTYSFDKEDSNKLQKAAHYVNKFLLKPRFGMLVDRLVVSQKRVGGIIKWVKISENHEQLMLAVEEILSGLEFGVKADRFEACFDSLGKALGFTCERPDKEWKEGPDNLWALEDGKYLLVECKNEVLEGRTEINKGESGQMNNACAWFAKNYEGAGSVNILIIPTNQIAAAAGFNEPVFVMSDRELKKLRSNVRNFFRKFQSVDWNDCSEEVIQGWLNFHELSVRAIEELYCRSVKDS